MTALKPLILLSFSVNAVRTLAPPKGRRFWIAGLSFCLYLCGFAGCKCCKNTRMWIKSYRISWRTVYVWFFGEPVL